MTRALATALVALLAGLPLLVHPSWPLAAVALAAATASAAGIVTSAMALVTAGAALALIEYTIAVWLAAGPPNVLGAGVFGLALVLLLEVADFTRRVRGVLLGPRVLPEHAQHWLATGVAALAVTILLGAAASALTIPLPRPTYPALVAVGALLVFVGAAVALRAGMRPR